MTDYAYPSYLTAHKVPDGETHKVTVVVTNTNNIAAVEVLGNVGLATDCLNKRIATETPTILGPYVLVGGDDATIRISAISNPNSIHVSGWAEVQRDRYRPIPVPPEA